MVRPFSLPIFLLCLSAPAVAQTSPSAEKASVQRAIDAGNAAYIAAFKQADAKALSQVYDAQGSRLNEGGSYGCRPPLSRPGRSHPDHSRLPPRPGRPRHAVRSLRNQQPAGGDGKAVMVDRRSVTATDVQRMPLLQP